MIFDPIPKRSSVEFDYLETLPRRDRTQALETLTSLILRHCELNRIISMEGVEEIFFPSQGIRVVRNYADYPPISTEALAKALAVRDSPLVYTTFYGVGERFGRSTHPQALSRFLSGAIATKLRFCPECLCANRYYRLTWRFTLVDVCTIHGCKLLDCCTYCGNPIPLFGIPLKVGICARCGKDLSTCNSIPIDSSEYEKNLAACEEIEWLLSMKNWIATSEVILKVGIGLLKLRRERNLTILALAEKTGITPVMVEGIEHGNIMGRGANFLAYWNYAHYVGVSLKELFQTALNAQDTILNSSKVSKEELIAATGSAIELLKLCNEPITGRAVASIVGTPRTTLTSYEEIALLIKEAEAERLAKLDAILLTRAQDMLDHQYVASERCTQETLAGYLGISRSTLRRSKHLMSLLQNR